MAPVESNDDYYAVLEISNAATIEVVTQSFKRLAKIRHPDRIREGGSTAAFQLLRNAYDTLKDPAERRQYDLKWPGIRDRLRAQQESDRCQAEAELKSDTRKAKVQQQWERCQAEQQQESHRRQAEVAKTEKRRATEAREKRQKEEKARQERLGPLKAAKSRYEREISDLEKVVRELAADLKHLEDQDDEESKKEEQSSWWGYPVSLIYGKVNETEEQKQVQATERLNRLQSHRIKKARLGENEAKIQRQRDALQQVSDEIVDKKDYVEGEKKKGEDEKRKREGKAKKPSRMKEEEKYQRMARAQKEGAAQERARMTTAAEGHQNNWVNPASMYTCPHENFWVPIRGFHTCQVCQDAPSAFQCLGCKMVECSGCFRGVNKRL